MENDEIFRISKDKERAKDLLVMARERLELIVLIPKGRDYKVIEEYYEIIKELLTAIMYADGYKTLSHVKLIDYFFKNYGELNDKQMHLIDVLRKHRIGILYYGRKISNEFLLNNEEEIKEIVSVFSRLLENKLK